MPLQMLVPIHLQEPYLKYRLPGDPDVTVDLIDDEDVKLMFDEWADFQADPSSPKTAKLHIYVQWRTGRRISSRAEHVDPNRKESDQMNQSSESIERHSGGMLLRI